MWVDHTVWWSLYPLGFLGAEAEALPPGSAPVPRLAGLEPWLDYAIELGCSGIALGPVFASETHGYDTVDHLRVDPRLGTDEDFDKLVVAAHSRGLRLLLDGVFNHVGRGFPQFTQATADPAAARWFRWQDRPDGSRVPETFEGHDLLVALNHAEPAVAEYVARVMGHWLARGADGWRLDAAYAVPHAFWRDVLPQVRAQYPDAWFVGEYIHGDFPQAVREGGLDSVTQYELWKAIWSSLNDRNFFELSWTLDRHNDLLDSFTPLTFVGNHDVTRLATRLTDPRHFGHAVAILLLVGGIPSVYAGDEQAFHGLKEDRVGGDEAIRPTFPAGPGSLAPSGWPAYRLHQRLIGLRRRNPWLVTARARVEHLSNGNLALRSVPADSSHSGLLLLLNIDDEPFRFAGAGRASTVVADAEPGSESGEPLLLPPHSWRVLSDG